MTPSRAAQEKPTSPRTEAGRTLVQRMLSSKTDDRMGPDDLQRAILAIEREAATATPSLTDGLLGDILDLFLPFLDEPHDYRARQDRLDERLRKAHVLERMIRARLDEGGAR